MATLVVIVVYAGSVAFLDVFVAHRLVVQVQRQLKSRLDAARVRPPALATEEPDSPGSGVHYGLGIYGEPIYVWEVRPHRSRSRRQTLTRRRCLRWPGPRRVPGSVTRSLSGTDYRLLSVKYRGGLLVAGESLTELTHVESVLTISELVAAPVLLIAIFLASLLIGLRSARPIELARRRQLEFTADASHELRTPLSVIEAELSLARGLDAGSDPAALDRIARESERLKRIVDDLLWLARFDAAPPPPRLRPDRPRDDRRGLRRALRAPRQRQVARPSDGTARSCARVRSSHRLSGSTVSRRCSSTTLASSPARRGAVRVEVGRVGSRVVFAVEDTGPGIPPAERERAVRPVQARHQSRRRSRARPRHRRLGRALDRRQVAGRRRRTRSRRRPLGGVVARIGRVAPPAWSRPPARVPARRRGSRPPAGGLPLAEDELLDGLGEALVLIRGGDAIGLPLHALVRRCPSRSRDPSS